MGMYYVIGTLTNGSAPVGIFGYDCDFTMFTCKSFYDMPAQDLNRLSLMAMHNKPAINVLGGATFSTLYFMLEGNFLVLQYDKSQGDMPLRVRRGTEAEFSILQTTGCRSADIVNLKSSGVDGAADTIKQIFGLVGFCPFKYNITKVSHNAGNGTEYNTRDMRLTGCDYTSSDVLAIPYGVTSIWVILHDNWKSSSNTLIIPPTVDLVNFDISISSIKSLIFQPRCSVYPVKLMHNYKYLEELVFQGSSPVDLRGIQLKYFSALKNLVVPAGSLYSWATFEGTSWNTDKLIQVTNR